MGRLREKLAHDKIMSIRTLDFTLRPTRRTQDAYTANGESLKLFLQVIDINAEVVELADTPS
jgi:hypothetical protein